MLFKPSQMELAQNPSHVEPQGVYSGSVLDQICTDLYKLGSDYSFWLTYKLMYCTQCAYI